MRLTDALWIVATVSLVCIGRTDAADNSTQPNVVLIVVDDLGWTGLTCYGSDLHETPRIDRLAQQSIRFRHAYAAAPICSPTRASLMTGRAPARLNLTIWYESSGPPNLESRRRLLPPTTRRNLPLEETTVAELLREQGYQTFHVGKWHLGDAAHYPLNHGFDVNIGGTFWGCPATFFYPYRGYWGSRREMRYVPDLPFGKEGDYLTDRLTTEAINLMRRASDDPFFLNLCYYTVHTPIEGPPESVAYYQEKVLPHLDHQNAEYAAMHHSLDANVGRVLDTLDALEIADETIVLFCSDNGGYVNDWKGVPTTVNTPLRSGKGSLYEGGIRIPFLVRMPDGRSAGAVIDEPMVTTDVLPTILDLLGLELDPNQGAGLDGISFADLINDPNGRLPMRTLGFHYPHYYPTTTPVSAIRHGDWKLMHYYENDRWELYNLATDPSESRDLSVERPQQLAQMRHRLESWLQQVNAQMPIANPNAATRD